MQINFDNGHDEMEQIVFYVADILKLLEINAKIFCLINSHYTAGKTHFIIFKNKYRQRRWYRSLKVFYVYH